MNKVSKFWSFAFILISLILMLSVSSCEKKEEPWKGDPSTPSGVVSQFNRSLLAGDFDKAYGFLAETSREQYNGEEPFGKVMAKLLEKEASRKELKETRLIKEHIAENTAVVNIRYPESGDRKTMKDREIRLLNENGEWKIDI